MRDSPLGKHEEAELEFEGKTLKGFFGPNQ